MKKLLIAVAAIALLGGGAVVALPLLVPAEAIRDRVAAEIERSTGRRLDAGEVSIAVFPNLAVEIADLRLADAPGRSGDMVALDRLTVSVKLLPLLSGRVELDSFILDRPVVALATDRQGRGNWEFGEGTGGNAQQGDGGGLGLKDLALGEVRINDGTITYHDAQSGQTQEVRNVSLTVELDSLDQPLTAKGSLTWRERKLSLNLTAQQPRALIEGGETPLRLALDSDLVKTSLDGRLVQGETPRIDGKIDLSVPALPELAAWAGQPLDMPVELGGVTLKGSLAASPASIALSQTKLTLDEVTAEGDIAVALNGPRPRLTGTLALGPLMLDRYLPPPAEEAAPSSSAAAGWSDAPLDLSALKTADADLGLSVASVQVRDIKIGASTARLVLNNGKLEIDLTETALYDGKGKLRLVLDGSGAVPGIEAQWALTGLKAQPFLTDAAGFQRLIGMAATDGRIQGRGSSEREIVSSLNGEGSLSFTDGAIAGFNLAGMVRNVQAAFIGASLSNEPQQTDFTELTGRWTMQNGTLRNNDLSLLSPLLRVGGEGIVNLPQRRVDYRIEPKAVPSLEGQGGQAELTGLLVPVVVDGPWDALSFRPDLGAVVRDRVERRLIGDHPAVDILPTPTTPSPSPSGSNPLTDTLRGILGEKKGEPATPTQ
ncbi:AsmA family protein [Telmatospirillum sp. J64-1]|uniref:AsmA family protein n=1 Tax=Telmatospirillum sp. J64-1 TaxID=2502183 RepID=UPI00115E8DE8|nr:AsmA family protein [Telmatospirillum sp. J64-1]